MNDFKPYADESAVLKLGNLAIENRVDRISLSGDAELTKDKAGLALARHLQTVVKATVKALEADKALPDAVQVVKPQTVKNPFA